MYHFDQFQFFGNNEAFTPPSMNIPILFGEKILDSKTCNLLRKKILSEEKKIIQTTPAVTIAGIKHGLTPHWQSYNVLSWDGDAINTLKQQLADAYVLYLKKAKIKRFPNTIHCWANVLREGGKLNSHVHNYENHQCLSVTISLSNCTTETVYTFPYPLKSLKTGKLCKQLNIKTQQGNIIFFPGWLSHYSTSSHAKSPRITLGIDIRSNTPSTDVIIPFDNGKKIHSHFLDK